MANFKYHLLVCGGTGCKASESDRIVDALNKEITENGLTGDAKVVATGCFGFCEKGPIVKVLPDNTFYIRVTPNDAAEIIAEHLLKGRKVERLLYLDPETQEHQPFLIQNTWVFIKSKFALPCAIADLLIQKTLTKQFREMLTLPLATVCPN